MNTPGPWSAGKSAGYETHGQMLVSSDLTGKTVAVVYEGDKDAALIAAAPKMLAFIKSMNYAFYAEGTPKAMKLVMAESKALIADAEART